MAANTLDMFGLLRFVPRQEAERHRLERLDAQAFDSLEVAAIVGQQGDIIL